MSFSYHICPVCDAPDIRKSVKTCGSRRCQAEWKTWSDTYRAKRMLRANMGAAERFQHDLIENAPDNTPEVTAADLEALEAAEPKPDNTPQFIRDMLNPDNFKPKGGDLDEANELPSQTPKTS